MGIYTKGGDKGQTSLYDGKRVSKGSLRVESYGTLDELGAFIGVAKNYVENEKIYNELEEIQQKLFIVMSNLATLDEDKIRHKMMEEDIIYLENLIDFYMSKIPKEFKFVLNGSNIKSAYLHVARTVCRRGERNIINLMENEYVDPLVLKYVNRLSDVLFAMTRYLEEDVTYVKGFE